MGSIGRPRKFYRSIYTKSKAKYSRGEIIVKVVSGLFYKYLLSSFLFSCIGALFTNPQGYSRLDLLIGPIMYGSMLFVDFKGYSDLSFGITKLLGIEPTRNFNYPFVSTSLKEFWSRWHISLSSWLRDYIYIPLGGNRKGKVRTYINLVIVMLVSGIWHGAGLTFVFWGLWHGVAIVFEKVVSLVKIKKSFIIKTIGYVFTGVIVNVGWIFFASMNVNIAKCYINTLLNPTVVVDRNISVSLILVIAVVYLLSFAGSKFQTFLIKMVDKLSLFVQILVFFLCICVILNLGPDLVPPFIYFTF